MKFDPQDLLRIYLDGSFTEEAQVEFDALMRKDPHFAQQVTDAVAERLGPLPEERVDAIAHRLEARLQDAWDERPTHKVWKTAARGAAILVAAGLAGLGVWRWGSFGDHQGMDPKVMGTHGAGMDLGTRSREPKTGPEDRGSSGVGMARPRLLSAPRAMGSQGSPTEALGRPTGASGAGEILDQGTGQEGNALKVEIQAGRPGQALVIVYDGQGNPVRHLFQGPVSAGDHFVDWDGLDDRGLPVPAGDYHVLLDLDGKRSSGVLKVLSR